MKNFVKIVGICVCLLIVLLVGISVLPFEKWTGINGMTIIFFVFLAVLLAYFIGLLVFVVKNRRKKVIEVVEFSAPNNMTPADAGYVIDKTVDDRDISSLLIYWAHKNYLTVIKSEEIILKKVKDADDDMKPYEKTFFNAMFNESEEVNLKDLPTLLKPLSTQISNQIKAENNEKYFSTKVANASMWFNLGITCILIFLSYFLGEGGNFSIFCGVVIFVISTIFSNISNRIYVQKRIKGFISYLIGLILFLIFSALNLVFSFTTFYSFILVGVATVLCLLTYILCPLVEYRNEEGKKALGSLLGLKNYIEITEKEKMEKMIKENPEQFYTVLPYAYVLNVSNEYIEQFNFVKTINKKNHKETTLAIGALIAFCIFGEGVSILGGLFGGSKKNKPAKNKK